MTARLAFLGHLEAGGASAERLRVFELGLLAGVGLAPVIDSCAICAGARYAGRTADVGLQVGSRSGRARLRRLRPWWTANVGAVRAALVALAATSLASAGDARCLPT